MVFGAIQLDESYIALQQFRGRYMNTPMQMLVHNVAWADEMAHLEPTFFDRLAQRQRPRVLWIGCSDSRVPAERITNSEPGALFVHRNIANLFAPEDDNVMSVLEYGVHVLEVEHIIVCGHYGCGGVLAALTPPVAGLTHVERRIAPLRALACRHGDELDALPAREQRVDRLAELNVLEQVRALRQADIVRSAARPPRVQAWIFGLHDGRIRVLDAGEAAATPQAAAGASPVTT
jgi:carbonic anhydrase